MNPPWIARMLLLAVAGEREADFVAGDLHEEFLYLCATRGRRASRRWYSWQVVRSLFPLWDLRMRNGEAAHIVAAAGLGVALPLLLLDRLWSFVYSLIPLKDGLERAPGFLAANVICACALAALCGATAGSFRRALAIAAAAAGAAALGVWGSAGAAPALYVWLVLLGAPASTLAAFQWKGRRTSV
ncbi:membrane hypothetical protein [Candidatus Sulfopaludibacter sp. SbA3]|nr:membrane hypothetical protein [Candidatus Sulfopaludibacter sp. SbA3]